jgi:hypothetical protein
VGHGRDDSCVRNSGDEVAHLAAVQRWSSAQKRRVQLHIEAEVICAYHIGREPRSHYAVRPHAFVRGPVENGGEN